MGNLLEPPPVGAKAHFADDTPRFLLTVDTEEAFDWDQPLTRDRHDLDHVPNIARFQEFCENEGVVPVYLVDWPIANSSHAADILRPALASGKAEIGVQLHPWVNPPFQEDVTQPNSFAGNLPAELEEAKFAALRDLIERNFGASPLIYRAGRYGVGPNTAAILSRHGIAIDTSVRPMFDYSSAGGPDFRQHPNHPYWADETRQLLELPLTSTWWGMLRRQGDWIYPRLWRAPALRGVLSRLAMLERVPLTPEGVSVEEAIHGIDMALDDGLPMLVLSFHSPSLMPGSTPYVRTEDDLDALYDWWRRILAYLAQRGVQASNVADVMANIKR